MALSKVDSTIVLAFLKDVSESEHPLRHRGALEILAQHLGFEVTYELGRKTVRDPVSHAEMEEQRVKTEEAVRNKDRPAMNEAKAAIAANNEAKATASAQNMK